MTTARAIPAPHADFVRATRHRAEAAAETREARAELHRALDLLDLERRAVFVMFELEDPPRAEIAAVTDDAPRPWRDEGPEDLRALLRGARGGPGPLPEAVRAATARALGRAGVTPIAAKVVLGAALLLVGAALAWPRREASAPRPSATAAPTPTPLRAARVFLRAHPAGMYTAQGRDSLV